MDNEKLIEFINNDIVSKHEDILSFKIHYFPDNFSCSEEFIFRVKFNLLKEDLNELHEFIESKLRKYYHKLNIDSEYMIILCTL